MKNILTKDFVREVLTVPSVSGHEERVRDLVATRGLEWGAHVAYDEKGNVYLTKNPEGLKAVPCVAAHIDTVHRENLRLVYSNELVPVQETTDKDGRTVFSAPGVGVGADDKAGVAQALAAFRYMTKDGGACKAAFFVGEETNMAGSSQLDRAFFDDVSVFVQFDSPGTDSSLSLQGQKLFTKEFRKKYLKPATDRYFGRDGIKQISYVPHPWTDTWQVMQKTDIMCVNAPCGYYQYHTVHEYVVYEEMLASACAMAEMLKACAAEGVKFSRPKEKPAYPTYSHWFSGARDGETFQPQLLESSSWSSRLLAQRAGQEKTGVGRPYQGFNYRGPGWRS